MPLPDTVMSKAAFIERTKAFGHSRSDELKRIDELLGHRDEALKKGIGTRDVTALKKAFEAWTKKAGPKWRTSIRNKSGAMEELEFQLAGGSVPATVRELDAAHARLGLIYLFAKTRVEQDKWKLLAQGGLDLAGKGMAVNEVKAAVGSATRTVVGGGIAAAKVIAPRVAAAKPQQKKPLNVPQKETEVPAVAIVAGANEATSLLHRAGGAVREFWDALTRYLTDFAKNVWSAAVTAIREKIKGSASAKAYAVIDMAWAPVAAMVNSIVAKVAAQAAPFVSGGIAIATGLKSLCEGLYHRYRSYAAGKGVMLADGHPAAIADAINTAMNINIGKGLYETLKGGASIAMTATSFGASAVVDLIIAGAEIIVGLIHRTLEVAQINAFCADCRERFQHREEWSGIHNSPAAFGAWFNSAASSAPAIAALTLASGMAGDKMQYLKMFSAGGEPIAQSAFDRGVAYLDQLKGWSQPYLAKTGYVFLSDDDVVQGRLMASTSSNTVYLTRLKLAS